MHAVFKAQVQSQDTESNHFVPQGQLSVCVCFFVYVLTWTLFTLHNEQAFSVL